eukprot:6569174-Pyramimonas_sp.AAC.1
MERKHASTAGHVGGPGLPNVSVLRLYCPCRTWRRPSSSRRKAYAAPYSSDGRGTRTPSLSQVQHESPLTDASA